MGNHRFNTKQDALDAGYKPVNRKTDKDISGVDSFGYNFQNKEGDETVTVWISEELRMSGQKGYAVPMYPPKQKNI